MTEELGTDGPESDAQIRALLAELGSGPDGESMPPEVAARLDDTLARLVAERGHDESPDASDMSDASDGPAPSEGPGTVVPLRRRWLPRLTAAAAAVVVLGAGGVAATNLGLFGNDQMNSADSSATGTEGAATAKSAPNAAGGDTADQAATPAPELSAASFAADVETLLQRRSPALGTPEDPAPGARSGVGEKSPGYLQNRDQAEPGQPEALGELSCPGPETSDGSVTHPVRFEGRPAVLVVHPERAAGRLVEAWDCSGVRRLATTTLTP